MNKRIKALFLEDCEEDALCVVERLRMRGYDCDYKSVFKWEDYLESLNDVLDIIFADYSTSGFSALEAIQELCRQQLDIPFIIVSASMDEESFVEAMKAGAHDYITKDNLKRLIPVLERELREAEIRRDRNRALEELKKSEECYKALIENMDLGLMLIDDSYNILMSNKAVNSIIAKNDDEVSGKKCFSVLENGSGPCPNCPGERTMVSLKITEAHRKWSRGPNRGINVRLVAFPVISSPDHANSFILTVEDITEKVRTEEQIQHKAQLEAVGRLAGSVAHDFNNLLTAILGYSDFLLNGLPEGDPNRDKALQIHEASKRAAELTGQLLAFSRKQVLKIQPININSVTDAFKKILYTLVGRNIRLYFHLDPHLKIVKADPRQFEQVIMNLVINARDAMSSGGEIVIGTRNASRREIVRHMSTDLEFGDYVVFSVKDNGVGMDEATTKQMFQPFFTTKEKGKGTGLGLSTVYGIVEQHNGHVFFSSQPGKGTIFEVYVPAYEETTVSIAAPSAETTKGGETVLIVEDEVAIRNLAAESLELQGYRVLTAMDIDDALDLVMQFADPIDMMVSDIILPRTDGPTLYSKLLYFKPDMKSLYISGYPKDLLLEKGLLRESDKFVQKPFILEEFLDEVRRILNNHPS